VSGDFDVLVLAAGKSTRIAAVAQGRPKPLISIEGQSILERNLRWLSLQGIHSLWINLHYKPDEIRNAIGDGSRLGLAIRYSFEPEISGTAGAYKNLEREFARTALIVYGDSLLFFDLARFLAAHRSSKAEASIAVFDQGLHPHTGIAGGRVLTDADGNIHRFEESGGSGDSHPGLVNAGVYFLEPSVLPFIPANTFFDFGRDVFPRMLQAGRRLFAYVIEKEGYCLGLDRPDSFNEALQLIQTRVKLR